MLLCDGSRDHIRIWSEFLTRWVKLQRWESALESPGSHNRTFKLKLSPHWVLALVASPCHFFQSPRWTQALLWGGTWWSQPAKRTREEKQGHSKGASFLLCLCSSGSMQKSYTISPCLGSLDPVSAALSLISFFYIRLLGSPLGTICQ